MHGRPAILATKPNQKGAPIAAAQVHAAIGLMRRHERFRDGNWVGPNGTEFNLEGGFPGEMPEIEALTHPLPFSGRSALDLANYPIEAKGAIRLTALIVAEQIPAPLPGCERRIV